jgi:hypothetical protein
MADRLSALYRDLLDGTYDCIDRIVLNAYFRMGHKAGGPQLATPSNQQDLDGERREVFCGMDARRPR